MYAMFVLPVAGARPAAGLVQVRTLPFARGCRSARRAQGFRHHATEGHRNPRVGFDLRDPLPGIANAPPPGTEGWNEDKLAELVTRDSMIGAGLPKSPKDVK